MKEAWQKVEPMTDAATRLFYDRLFEIDATTRQLFKTTDLTEQAARFMLSDLDEWRLVNQQRDLSVG